MATDLFSQYQTKLAPITAQSENLLKEYLAMQAQQPSFLQKLLDAIKQSGNYPNQASMREEYMANPNLTPMAIESLVSRRGASTRGTIQDVMNRAAGGFQSDIAQKQGMAQLAQQQRQNLLEEYGLAEKARESTSTPNWQDYLDIFNQGQDKQEEELSSNITEPKPAYSPRNIGAISQGGQWYFTGNLPPNDDWIPIVD